MKKLLLILGLLIPLVSSPANVALSRAIIEATIFSFDGQDFVRSETTLTEDGNSVAETKLDRDGNAYKALINKKSYVGPTTLFGRDFQANYAPIVGDDGTLVGALFVGVPK